MSIVTPSYNQARFLEETIRSVLLQGYPDLEYIVLDGGSTDGSLDVIRRYEAWLAHWTSGPDGGQTQAINAGWARASGTVLAWINSDDVYLPGAVSTAVEALESMPGAGMAYGSAIVTDEVGRELRLWRARAFTLRAMLQEGNLVPQPAAFFAREALDAVGYLDDRWQMIMDYALCVRIGLRFGGISLPRVLARFRDHPGSKSRTRHAAMAREVLRLLDELEPDTADLPAWPAIRRRTRSRVHFEWALSSVAGEGPAPFAARELRHSLRADPAYALTRPLQTAYLAKEILRRGRSGLLAPVAEGDTLDRGAPG